MAGIGPLSTIARNAARWVSSSLDGCSGGLRSIRPPSSWVLNFTTQSRMICSVPPPVSEAAVRDAPSYMDASASRRRVCAASFDHLARTSELYCIKIGSKWDRHGAPLLITTLTHSQTHLG